MPFPEGVNVNKYSFSIFRRSDRSENGYRRALRGD
jgi:hypothetical protein